MNLEIITPHSDRFPLLSSPSHDLSFPLKDHELTLISDMCRYLSDNSEALGLAAVQVGHPVRLFVMAQHNKPREFINAEIIRKSKKKTNDSEGCLSLPGVYLRIKRHSEVTLKYYDKDGNNHIEEFRGLWARAAQHEMDHINGRLIYDLN